MWFFNKTLEYEEYEYKGLVVTTCEINRENEDKEALVKDLERDEKVTFNQSSRNGTQVVFLKNVEYKDKKRGPFRAKYVTPKDAARMSKLFAGVNKTNKDVSPLFCVHGFNVQPGSIMSDMSRNYNRFKEIEKIDEKGFKYCPVPVIWPCTDDGNYLIDQDKPSQGAGNNLNLFVQGIKEELFPRKSLLMHSMGNHVIFDGACGFKENNVVKVSEHNINFENIFMVAADLPKDIFCKNPYDYDTVLWGKERAKRIYGQKKQKAKKLF